jgi:hypothetical protein
MSLKAKISQDPELTTDKMDKLENAFCQVYEQFPYEVLPQNLSHVVANQSSRFCPNIFPECGFQPCEGRGQVGNPMHALLVHHQQQHHMEGHLAAERSTEMHGCLYATGNEVVLQQINARQRCRSA